VDLPGGVGPRIAHKTNYLELTPINNLKKDVPSLPHRVDLDAYLNTAIREGVIFKLTNKKILDGIMA